MQSLLDYTTNYIFEHNIKSSDNFACLFYGVVLESDNTFINNHILHAFTIYCMNYNYVNACKKLFIKYLDIMEKASAEITNFLNYFKPLLKILHQNKINFIDIMETRQISNGQINSFFVKFICKKYHDPVNVLSNFLTNNICKAQINYDDTNDEFVLDFDKININFFDIINKNTFECADEIISTCDSKIKYIIYHFDFNNIWKLAYIKNPNNLKITKIMDEMYYSYHYSRRLANKFTKKNYCDFVIDIVNSLRPDVFTDVFMEICKMYCSKILHVYFYYIANEISKTKKINIDKLDMIIDMITINTTKIPINEIQKHYSAFEKFIIHAFHTNYTHYLKDDKKTIIKIISKAKKYFAYPKKLKIEKALGINIDIAE